LNRRVESMSISIEPSPFFERRSGIDRRSGNLPDFSRYWLTGKRAAPRRREDREKDHRLDRYSRNKVAIILSIILLSIIDAVLTLYLIERGATEMNPIMDYYLGHGPLVFFGVKYFLTCASLLIVLLKENDRLFKTRIQMKTLFTLFLIPYVLVVQWEIYLILSQ
jgi:hypothetical protein